jgi:hypothetical protein
VEDVHLRVNLSKTQSLKNPFVEITHPLDEEVLLFNLANDTLLINYKLYPLG